MHSRTIGAPKEHALPPFRNGSAQQPHAIIPLSLVDPEWYAHHGNQCEDHRTVINDTGSDLGPGKVRRKAAATGTLGSWRSGSAVSGGVGVEEETATAAGVESSALNEHYPADDVIDPMLQEGSASQDNLWILACISQSPFSSQDCSEAHCCAHRSSSASGSPVLVGSCYRNSDPARRKTSVRG